MDFLELAKNRYSERFFDSRPVVQAPMTWITSPELVAAVSVIDRRLK